MLDEYVKCICCNKYLCNYDDKICDICKAFGYKPKFTDDPDIIDLWASPNFENNFFIISPTPLDESVNS